MWGHHLLTQLIPPMSLILVLFIALLSCVHSYSFLGARAHRGVTLKPPTALFSTAASDEAAMYNQAEASEPKGSGIGSYYQEVLSLLAKVPYSDLRQLIEKCKPSNMPDISADSEMHISMALDAAWSYSKGDWNALLSLVRDDLSLAASEATFQLEIALAAGKRMSEKRVKELIVFHGTPNSIPKLDKRKFTGKLLKDDYVVELIDILREKYQNDYQRVAQVLEMDYLSTKKTGFGL